MAELKKMMLIEPKMLENILQKQRHEEKKRTRVLRASKSKRHLPIDQHWYNVRRLLNEYMSSKEKSKIVHIPPKKSVSSGEKLPSLLTSTPVKGINPKFYKKKIGPGNLSQFEAIPSNTDKYHSVHLMRKLPTKDSPSALLVQKEGKKSDVYWGDEADSYYEDGDGLSFANPIHERNILYPNYPENMSPIPKEQPIVDIEGEEKEETEEEKEDTTSKFSPYTRGRSLSDAASRLRPKQKLVEPIRWERMVKH